MILKKGVFFAGRAFGAPVFLIFSLGAPSARPFLHFYAGPAFGVPVSQIFRRARLYLLFF